MLVDNEIERREGCGTYMGFTKMIIVFATGSNTYA